MTHCQPGDRVVFVYDNNTPGDIKELLESKYPSATATNIDDIETLKQTIIQRKKAQVVAVIFDGIGGESQDVFRKTGLELFKEKMGQYFESNVVFVKVFSTSGSSRSRQSVEGMGDKIVVANNTSMQPPQVDENFGSDWFSTSVQKTSPAGFIQIKDGDTADFDSFITNVTIQTKSFQPNCFEKIRMFLLGLVAVAAIV